MKDEQVERWRVLCQEAVQEADPERLLSLIERINALLDEKLGARKPQPPQPSVDAK